MLAHKNGIHCGVGLRHLHTRVAGPSTHCIAQRKPTLKGPATSCTFFTAARSDGDPGCHGDSGLALSAVGNGIHEDGEADQAEEAEELHSSLIVHKYRQK